MRKEINLQEIYDTFDELAKKYSLDKSDVELLFYSVLEEIFDAKFVTLDNKGLIIDGVYYDYFSKDVVKKINNILPDKLIEFSLERQKDFIENLIRNNRNILFARVTKKGTDKVACEVFIDEKKTLKNFYAIIKNDDFKITERIKIFPIYLFEHQINRINHNTFIANATTMNRKLVKYHLDKFLYPKLRRINPELELKINKFVKRDDKRYIEFLTKNFISKFIFEKIRDYFSSFGYEVFIKKTK